MEKANNFFLLVVMFMGVASSPIHEYYVSTTTIRWVAKKKEIQLTSRFFLDDLETLMQQQDPKVVFSPDSDPVQIDNFIKEFYIRNISLSIDNSPQSLTYIGREYKDDLLVIYAQIDTSKFESSTVRIQNSFLINLFEDQQNIVHLITPNDKKSFLLNRGATTVTFNIGG